ncbi:hypothetical protein ACFLW2_02040 [Chloroflexota bacterium]
MGNDGLPVSLAILFGGVILGALILVAVVIMAVFGYMEADIAAETDKLIAGV